MKYTYRFNNFIGNDVIMATPQRPNSPVELLFVGTVLDKKEVCFCYDVYDCEGNNNEIYNQILIHVRKNIDHFTKEKDWGYIKLGYVNIIGQQYDRIMCDISCDEQNFSKWAIDTGIIKSDRHGNKKTVCCMNSKSVRCVKLKLPDEFEI